MLASLGMSLQEILIAIKALNLKLSDMEKKKINCPSLFNLYFKTLPDTADKKIVCISTLWYLY